jgi:anti-anti-sigma regulatory factor
MGHAVLTTNDGTRVITLHGTIADPEASQLRTSLIDAIWRDRARHVVVELRHGVSIDATFFGALVAADAVATDRDATIELPPILRTPGVRWAAASRKDVVYACPSPA